MIASYLKNAVLENDGTADLEGLSKYCSDRSIPLQKIPTYADQPKSKVPAFSPAQSPFQRRSPPALNSQASSSAIKYFSFTLKNNSKRTVRIFIGQKPKDHGGRSRLLEGKSSISEHGQSGDQLCIVDEQDNPISCTTLGESISGIEINSSGTGFGAE